jgi:predicted ATPase
LGGGRKEEVKMKDDRKMIDDFQHDSRAIELDPDLLSTPFEVQTNWHVITGAACSGKTTLIDLLADQGFQTVPEIARQFIEREVARGRTIDEIFENGAIIEPVLADLQMRTEHGLRAPDIVFLDRGLPDYLFFYRVFGLNPNEILAECFQHRYASVFLLDRLPLQLDGARIEDDTYTVLLDEWLVRDYSALGYCVVRVPVLSPQDRLTFVLERLFEQGQIQVDEV